LSPIRIVIEYVGVAWFVASIVGAGLYAKGVYNSGTVVATADVASTRALEKPMERLNMGQEIRYERFQFTPVQLNPEMGEVKIQLVKRGGLSTADGRRLKSPSITVLDAQTQQVILKNEDVKREFSIQFLTEQLESSYEVGRFLVPRPADYIVVAEFGSMASSSRVFTLVLKSGAEKLDYNKLIPYAVSLILSIIVGVSIKKFA